MSFDLQTTANIATLARLNLDEAGKEKMAGEIAGILKWVEQLQEVDVTNVEPGQPADARRCSHRRGYSSRIDAKCPRKRSRIF